MKRLDLVVKALLNEIEKVDSKIKTTGFGVGFDFENPQVRSLFLKKLKELAKNEQENT